MAETLSIATVSLESGGRLGICRLPGLSGDLASDVRAIVDWKPTILVSMTERAEMDRYGGGDLASLLAGASIEWRHFPIRDYGEPQGAGRDAWPKLATRLHSVLDERGAILLHCHGGRGRSGMIALRLLVERGEDANSALARLRSARPHAVETEAQLAWASAGSTNPWKPA
jgi:hypothetical protein